MDGSGPGYMRGPRGIEYPASTRRRPGTGPRHIHLLLRAVPPVPVPGRVSALAFSRCAPVPPRRSLRPLPCCAVTLAPRLHRGRTTIPSSTSRRPTRAPCAPNDSLPDRVPLRLCAVPRPRGPRRWGRTALDRVSLAVVSRFEDACLVAVCVLSCTPLSTLGRDELRTPSHDARIPSPRSSAHLSASPRLRVRAVVLYLAPRGRTAPQRDTACRRPSRARIPGCELQALERYNALAHSPPTPIPSPRLNTGINLPPEPAPPHAQTRHPRGGRYRECVVGRTGAG